MLNVFIYKVLNVEDRNTSTVKRPLELQVATGAWQHTGHTGHTGSTLATLVPPWWLPAADCTARFLLLPLASSTPSSTTVGQNMTQKNMNRKILKETKLPTFSQERNWIAVSRYFQKHEVPGSVKKKARKAQCKGNILPTDSIT